MNMTPVSLNYSIRRIAIVDDDKNAAEVAGLQVEDAGFEPVIVDSSFDTANELASFIKNSAQGALCDHRLAHYGFANFYGASVVASLYDLRVPAILVTQYTEIDKDVSIRKYRHKIPILLSRDEANPSTIKRGFADCVSELSGNIQSTRQPHRTLLVITNLSSESNEQVVDVIIPSWNPNKAVRFPTLLIPQHLHDQLAPDVWLFAHINIGAEKSEDLYFTQFELAPELDDSNGLT